MAMPVEAKRRKKAMHKVQREMISDADARRLSYFYQEGMKCKLTGRMSEAYDMFQHCLSIDPNNPDALFEVGYFCFYTNQDSLGTAIFRHVLEIDDRNPRYVQSLAAAYLASHKYSEAIPLLERLAELQPRRSDVLYELIDIYKADGKTDQAIKILDRIELLDGRTLQTCLQKYALYIDKGEKERAFSMLEEFQKESPYDMRIPIIRGKQYLQDNQPEKALECFREVERVEPQNTDLRLAMMEYYAETGQDSLRIALRDSLLYSSETPDQLRAQMTALFIEEMKQDSTMQESSILSTIDSLIRRSPSALMHSLKVSYLMYAKADEKVIVQAMRDLLEVDATNENALSRLLVYYLEQKDMEHAAEICRMGINAHPETLIYHFYLGLALSQLKQTEEAIAVLQNGLNQANEESQPERISDIYEILGELYYEQGRKAEAFAAYDSCLVYKDDNAACLNNYAYYLSLRNERLEEAERMAYRAIKLEPLNKTYLDTYAWVLFMKGNYTMAKFYIDRVISPTQTDEELLEDESVHADVLEHAGDIYALCDDINQAMRYWSLARRKDCDSTTLITKLKMKQYIKP